jgi:hypothetical protein
MKNRRTTSKKDPNVKIKIRDLKPVKDAKGGDLMKSCASGEHIKKLTLTG